MLRALRGSAALGPCDIGESPDPSEQTETHSALPVGLMLLFGARCCGDTRANLTQWGRVEHMTLQ